MRYDWLMLELYDQAVRKVSGGNMAAYLAEQTDPNRVAFRGGTRRMRGEQAVDSPVSAFPPGLAS